MATTRKWTRDSAIDYLEHNPNFLWLRSQNSRITSPRDMGTAQLKRYASAASTYEREGRWARQLGEWRGHVLREHHKGRAPKRDVSPEVVALYQRQIEIGQIPKGRFDQPIIQRDGKYGTISGYVRRTSFESQAVRELGSAAARDHSVHIGVAGPEKGQYRNLFTGGFRARLLLHDAGYRQNPKTGRWRKAPGGGLEEYLLDFMETHDYGYGGRWATIRLYEIFVEETGLAKHEKPRKRDPWPYATAPRGIPRPGIDHPYIAEWIYTGKGTKRRNE